jgi:hypothetical protein
MTSFELDIVDEKSRAGSQFMFRITQELQRAFLVEKKTRKITQQAIADKLGTSRAVINRQIQGLENIGARRIGELFWAMGWIPQFSAEKIPEQENDSRATSLEVGYVILPDAANQNIFKIRASAAASAG